MHGQPNRIFYTVTNNGVKLRGRKIWEIGSEIDQAVAHQGVTRTAQVTFEAGEILISNINKIYGVENASI